MAVENDKLNEDLIRAIDRRDYPGAKAAIEAGADPDYKPGPFDHTPLMKLATEDSSPASLDMADFLLKRGVDPSKKSSDGKTPAEIADMYENTAMANKIRAAAPAPAAVSPADNILAGISNGDAPPLRDVKPEPEVAAAPPAPVPPADGPEPGGAEKKKKPEAEIPQQPIPATASEEPGEKKKVDGVEVPKPAPASAPTEDEPLDNEKLKHSKFATNFDNAHLATINALWGVPDVDPQLKEALANVKKTKRGLDFELNNGHHVEWIANLQNQGEFIGTLQKNPQFDITDAQAVVAAGKSRGWKSLNVYGSAEHKGLMWLEAQRQGLAVTNYAPPVNSDIVRQWEQEKSRMMTGAQPTSIGEPEIPNAAPAAQKKAPAAPKP